MLQQRLISELEKIQSKIGEYVRKEKSYEDPAFDVLLENLSNQKKIFSNLPEKDPQHETANALIIAIDRQLTALQESDEIRAKISNKNLLPNTRKKRI